MCDIFTSTMMKLCNHENVQSISLESIVMLWIFGCLLVFSIPMVPTPKAKWGEGAMFLGNKLMPWVLAMGSIATLIPTGILAAKHIFGGKPKPTGPEENGQQMEGPGGMPLAPFVDVQKSIPAIPKLSGS